MPADGSEQYAFAVVVHEAVLWFRTPIAALAHRLRATQSPPSSADVRRRMDPLSVGFLHAMHNSPHCCAYTESTQVESTSGSGAAVALNLPLCTGDRCLFQELVARL